MSESRMDDALQASYQELVEEIRTTTDMSHALESVHARIRENPQPASLDVSEEQPDPLERPVSGIGVGRLVHRLVLAVDVESFAARDVREQLRAQTDLQEVLSLAARDVGLDRKLWYERGTGDGELVVLPEDVDVSVVVGDFTRQLEMILGRFNRQAPSDRRLRLRLVLHHGTLTRGPFGPVGDAPIVVSRLLDARPLRRLLAQQQELDIAVMLSATLFEDVVRTGFCSLDPEDFQPVRVNAKGVQYHGFVSRKAAGMPRGNDEPTIRAVRATSTDPITH